MKLEVFLNQALEKDTFDVNFIDENGCLLDGEDVYCYDVIEVSYKKIAIIKLKVTNED